MKILVLGNSQVGALKVGFENDFSDLSPEIEFTFLGIPQQGFNHFRLEGKSFVIQKSFWSAIVSNCAPIRFPFDLSIFDRIVLVAGLSYLSPHLLYTQSISSVCRFSDSLLESSIITPPNTWDHIINTSSICASLMSVFRERVVFIGNALPGPREPLVKFLSNLPEDLQHIIRINSERIASLVEAKNLANSSSILLPPESVLCENKISLKADYYINGLRVNGEINGDYWHPNARYGSIMIREFLKFAVPGCVLPYEP